MKSILDRFLGVQAEDDLAAQRGRLLNILILTMSVANLVILLVDITYTRLTYLPLELSAFAIFGVVYRYSRRGHRWPSYIVLAFVVLLTPSIFDWNPQISKVIASAVPVAISPLIVAPWLSIPVAGAEIVMLYIISLVAGHPPPDPIVVITLGVLGAASWLSSSTLENALKEARRNASALAESNRELEAGRALLEAHTNELEQRSTQLEASAEVGRAATSILEIDRLIQQVVELIRERFGLYYVGLFLTGETGEWAVLRAGTGEPGQAMLSRGHQIKVGEGMVGWSVAHAQARVASEATEDSVRLATAELPDTRSEAALPLHSRGQVLGALTVQSTQRGTFDQDTMVALQIMADQVAVALDNARLFAEAREALEAERRAYSELSREAWAELLKVRPNLGFLKSKRLLSPAGDVWRPGMETALQTGQTILGEDSATSLTTPIKARGQVIGVIGARKPDDAGVWTQDEIALLETLAEQLSVALESARLYQDTQRRAVRERLTGEVTARMRETFDVETVLKTAAQEVRQALGLPEVVVRLAPKPIIQAGNSAGQSEK
ncbi:MAG: GAF domain-containing protein [Anaerolineae bacterium]